jgi:hypothetical protein
MTVAKIHVLEGDRNSAAGISPDDLVIMLNETPGEDVPLVEASLNAPTYRRRPGQNGRHTVQRGHPEDKCLRDWDLSTHLTKQERSRACQRVVRGRGDILPRQAR